jgi:Ca2+-dependent lipid-binding protein
MGEGLRDPGASAQLDGTVCQKILGGTRLIGNSFSKTLYNPTYQSIKLLFIISILTWLSGLEKGRSCDLVIRRTG